MQVIQAVYLRRVERAIATSPEEVFEKSLKLNGELMAYVQKALALSVEGSGGEVSKFFVVRPSVSFSLPIYIDGTIDLKVSYVSTSRGSNICIAWVGRGSQRNMTDFSGFTAVSGEVPERYKEEFDKIALDARQYGRLRY